MILEIDSLLTDSELKQICDSETDALADSEFRLNCDSLIDALSDADSEFEAGCDSRN